MNEDTKATIKSALKECDSHIKKLNRGEGLLHEVFPLKEESFKQLSEDNIEHIDQFVYRFIKLQDSMGTRLLPSFYSFLEADVSPKPFLDILNRLEQLGMAIKTADWQYLRNLRNNLAHDYPESVDQTVETLNALYADWRKLEIMYDGVRAKWETVE